MSTTPILGIPEVAPTQTDKTTTINDFMLALEGATQDNTPISLAGGDVTLTALQYTRNMVFVCSGQTAARNLIVPLTKRHFIVRNAGSTYAITVKGATGATVAIAAGDSTLIYNDGTDCTTLVAGSAGPTGPTGPAGAISSLILGQGLNTGTIVASGQTITADWHGGTVAAIGTGLTLALGTLTATASVSRVVGGGGLDGTVTSNGTITLATIANNDILANTSGITAAPVPTTVSALLDAAIGATQGDILYRSGTAWTVLGPGSSGQVLTSGGAGANPAWAGATAARNSAEMLAQWVLGAVAGNGTFYFAYKARYAGTITALDSIAGTGTFTAAVKINGTSVTGLSAVSVTAAATTTSATGANTFVAGDTISGVISSAAGSPTDAVLNLNVTWS